MQKRAPYVLGLLILVLFTSGMVLRADSNYCPDPNAKDQIVLDSPEELVTMPAGKGSVSRNQVLLEIGEGTW